MSDRLLISLAQAMRNDPRAKVHFDIAPEAGGVSKIVLIGKTDWRAIVHVEEFRFFEIDTLKTIAGDILKYVGLGVIDSSPDVEMLIRRAAARSFMKDFNAKVFL